MARGHSVALVLRMHSTRHVLLLLLLLIVAAHGDWPGSSAGDEKLASKGSELNSGRDHQADQVGAKEKRVDELFEMRDNNQDGRYAVFLAFSGPSRANHRPRWDSRLQYKF